MTAVQVDPYLELAPLFALGALDRLRRRASRREEPSESAPVPTAIPRTEEGIAVRKALDTLSDDQRRALELAYYEGLTQSEIAERLHEPLGTVKTRIRTALLRLREALQSHRR